jgi:hypothetical protein
MPTTLYHLLLLAFQLLCPLPPCVSLSLKTLLSQLIAVALIMYLLKVLPPGAPTVMSLEIADSLQHLDDADSVEFEVKDEEPVVKHTIKGKVGWTPTI